MGGVKTMNKKELKEKILALKDDEKLISLIKYTESDNYKLYVEDICNLENLKEILDSIYFMDNEDILLYCLDSKVIITGGYRGFTVWEKLKFK